MVRGMGDTDFEACGALITEARKRAGKSIAQMGEELSIRPSYLEMLEKGELHREVGPGYFRSILLNYVESLALDGERLLAELQSGLPMAESAEPPPSTGDSETRSAPALGDQVAVSPSSAPCTLAQEEAGVSSQPAPEARRAAPPPAAPTLGQWEGTRRRVDAGARERASDSTAYRVVMIVLLVLGVATAVLFTLPLLGLVA